MPHTVKEQIEQVRRAIDRHEAAPGWRHEEHMTWLRGRLATLVDGARRGDFGIPKSPPRNRCVAP